MTVRPDAKAVLRDRARVVAWGIAILCGVLFAGAYLAQNHTGAVIAQIVIAEFGTGRLGVAWSDPLAPMPTAKAIARRIGRGALLGAAAAVVLLGASVAMRAATLEVGSLSVASLVAGFVTSACVAARDELLLRGLVLRALGPTASFNTRIASAGFAAVAFRFGIEPSVAWPSLVFALFGGIACACLWMRDRGAWLAVSASTAFAFITGPVSQGALIDVRASGGSSALDASVAAVVCGVFFSASAIVWAGRKESGSIAP